MWILNKMLHDNAATGHQTAGFLLNEPRKFMLERKLGAQEGNKTSEFLHTPKYWYSAEHHPSLQEMLWGLCPCNTSLYPLLLF